MIAAISVRSKTKPGAAPSGFPISDGSPGSDLLQVFRYVGPQPFRHTRSTEHLRIFQDADQLLAVKDKFPVIDTMPVDPADAGTACQKGDERRSDIPDRRPVDMIVSESGPQRGPLSQPGGEDKFPLAGFGGLFQEGNSQSDPTGRPCREEGIIHAGATIRIHPAAIVVDRQAKPVVAMQLLQNNRHRLGVSGSAVLGDIQDMTGEVFKHGRSREADERRIVGRGKKNLIAGSHAGHGLQSETEIFDGSVFLHFKRLLLFLKGLQAPCT